LHLPSIDGREVVPVRLIPFLTGHKVGPTSLAKLLAHQVSLAFPLFREEDKLFAYHLSPPKVPVRLFPKEWDTLVSDLETLEKKFRNQENFEDELYAAWRIEAVKLLSAGVFVWKDELEGVFKAWRDLEAPCSERMGDRELNFSPVINRHYHSIIWEQFDHSPLPPSREESRKKTTVSKQARAENACEILVGYSDFVRLCRVDTPGAWGHGYRVAKDGVWIVPPPENITWITSNDRADLSDHPEKDLNKPALAFPCTLKQLQVFLEWGGVYGCIDPFDMADFIQEETKDGVASGEAVVDAPPKEANPKEIESLLKLVIAMAIKGYCFDPSAKKSPTPGEVASDAEQTGLSIDVDTVRKWLKRAAELLPPDWNRKE
jgi:hypothetical protein